MLITHQQDAEGRFHTKATLEPTDIGPAPCPFCGGGEVYAPEKMGHTISLRCNICGVHGPRCSPSEIFAGDVQGAVRLFKSAEDAERIHRDTLQRAIEAWNRRAIDLTAAEAVAEAITRFNQQTGDGLKTTLALMAANLTELLSRTSAVKPTVSRVVPVEYDHILHGKVRGWKLNFDAALTVHRTRAVMIEIQKRNLVPLLPPDLREVFDKAERAMDRLVPAAHPEALPGTIPGKRPRGAPPFADFYALPEYLRGSEAEVHEFFDPFCTVDLAPFREFLNAHPDPSPFP